MAGKRVAKRRVVPVVNRDVLELEVRPLLARTAEAVSRVETTAVAARRAAQEALERQTHDWIGLDRRLKELEMTRPLPRRPWRQRLRVWLRR